MRSGAQPLDQDIIDPVEAANEVLAKLAAIEDNRKPQRAQWVGGAQPPKKRQKAFEAKPLQD